MKLCKKCNLEKELIEFSTAGTYKNQLYYRPECKSCVRQYMKSEAARASQIKYRNTEKGKINKNKHKQTEKYKEQQKQYFSSRSKTDLVYRLKKNVRNRIRISLQRKRWNKNTHFYQYIGCSLEDLKYHLQSQFKPGMTWENYGFGIDKWTIDHIIPLASAKFPEELYKLCHYSNLQPLWAIDNIKKSDKI